MHNISKDIVRIFLTRFTKKDTILTTKEELEDFMLETLEDFKKRDHSKKICRQKIRKNN